VTAKTGSALALSSRIKAWSPGPGAHRGRTYAIETRKNSVEPDRVLRAARASQALGGGARPITAYLLKQRMLRLAIPARDL
jgi:hypothetical protein